MLVGLYFSFVSAKFSHATRTAEVVKNYLTSLRVPVSVCVCVCLLCVCVRLSASLACGFMKNWTICAWGQKFVVYDVARCAAAIFRVVLTRCAGCGCHVDSKFQRLRARSDYKLK